MTQIVPVPSIPKGPAPTSRAPASSDAPADAQQSFSTILNSEQAASREKDAAPEAASSGEALQQAGEKAPPKEGALADALARLMIDEKGAKSDAPASPRKDEKDRQAGDGQPRPNPAMAVMPAVPPPVASASPPVPPAPSGPGPERAQEASASPPGVGSGSKILSGAPRPAAGSTPPAGVPRPEEGSSPQAGTVPRGQAVATKAAAHSGEDHSGQQPSTAATRLPGIGDMRLETHVLPAGPGLSPPAGNGAASPAVSAPAPVASAIAPVAHPQPTNVLALDLGQSAMGPMHVRLRLTGDTLGVDVRAGPEGAAQIDRDGLRKSLEAAGYSVDSLVVRVTAPAQTAAVGQPQANPMGAGSGSAGGGNGAQPQAQFLGGQAGGERRQTTSDQNRARQTSAGQTKDHPLPGSPPARTLIV